MSTIFSLIINIDTSNINTHKYLMKKHNIKCLDLLRKYLSH